MLKSKVAITFHDSTFCVRSDYNAESLCDFNYKTNLLMHTHEFFEFYIHFQGAQGMCINEVVHTLEAHDLLIIPPDCLHGITGWLHGEYTRLFVYIAPRMLRALGCGLCDLEKLFTENNSMRNCKYRLTKENAYACKALAEHIALRKASTSQSDCVADMGELSLFLSIVMSTVCDKSSAVQPTGDSSTIQRVLLYIHKHYAQEIHLEDIGKHANISISYLSHEFPKYTGKSVYEYVLGCRVTAARAFIASGVSLTDTAYRCGFSGYSSFLRVFRRIAGKTPNQYRKELLNAMPE